MVQRAEAPSDLAGTLDVSEAEVWSDFDALLGADVLLDPGPEWRSMAEIKSHMPTLGANYVEALVKVQVREGKMETRRGPDRVTGKVMSLYRVTK